MALAFLSRHELAFIFGILGNVVSFGVYLAPLPTFWRVYKKKSTGGFQSIPYAVALFSAMLMLYYAFLKENNATMIITINTIGCAIESLYLTVYLIYAPKKAKLYTAKLLGLFNVGFYGLILVSTILFVPSGERETVVGWICAIFSVSVFAAPLSVMRLVIRTKSVEFMPFWLSFFLTLCAIMWFFYGFFIKDFYIALPNILGFAFGVTQMILYIIYKDSSKKQNAVIKEADIKQSIDHMIIKLDKVEKVDEQPTHDQVVDIVLVDQTVDNVPAVPDNDNQNHNHDGDVVDGEEVAVDVLPRVQSNV